MILRDAIQAALDEATDGGDRCYCNACKEIVKNAGDLTCETCGYVGPFMPYSCACYEHRCHPKVRGMGCGHGSMGCPVCQEGEASPWDIIKRVREVLAKAAVDEVVQEAQELGDY